MYRIIVADCTPSVFSAIQSVLSGPEYEILAFTDGTEVIKALKMVQPDLILLNLFLESKDGYEVCHFLNSQENYKKIPIFLLKSAFETIDEFRMSGLEYRELIAEPFDSLELAHKIKDVLDGDNDPLTLPEEPVLAEESRLSPGFEEKLKNLVSEELLKNEDKMIRRLKDRLLDEIKQELSEE